MADLSPAAQAMLDAYHQEAIDYIEDWGSFSHKRGLAAALEAVAYQVVPYEEAPLLFRRLDLERLAQRQHTRAQLLDIAAELRGNTTTQKEN